MEVPVRVRRVEVLVQSPHGGGNVRIVATCRLALWFSHRRNVQRHRRGRTVVKMRVSDMAVRLAEGIEAASPVPTATASPVSTSGSVTGTAGTQGNVTPGLAPLAFYQVAAPLLLALLVALVAQFKWHQEYFTWRDEKDASRLIPLLAGGLAAVVFGVLLSGVLASLAALRYGPTERTEAVAAHALGVGVSITFGAAAYFYIKETAQAANRWRLWAYIGMFAVFIAVVRGFTQDLPMKH
jgi:hypothetical protein